MSRRRQRYARANKRTQRIGRSKRSGFRRSLNHERLEDRHVLALLGIGPLSLPLITYDSGGNVNYNNTTDTYSIHATPLTIDTPSNPTGFFFTGSAVNVTIKVDGAGTLIGGVPGNDFALTGDVDVNGDFVPDYLAINGPLLTGEISQFGYLDTGSTTDRYDFRFTVTGGQLASYWAGKDIGMLTTSETSTFTNNFNVDFHGGAKGQIGAIDKQSAHLSGHKYSDLTGNGFSGDDTPLANVTISLYQDFGTVGTLDGPDVLYASTVTNGNGLYSFENLPPGNYLVQESVPAGYQATTPTTLAITLAAGGNVTTGFDFDNFQYAHITGTKFTDITGNSFSADDTPLGGVTINLYQGTSAAGPLVASTVTANDGTYSFDNLGPGTYFVQESVPNGYLQTGGNAGYVVTVGGTGVIGGGTSSGNNFDNAKKGKISGYKWNDLNGNAVWEANEPGLGGFTIELYKDDGDGDVDGVAISSDGTTDANGDGSINSLDLGYFQFTDLAPGSYEVLESYTTRPPGWTQTFPPANLWGPLVISANSTSFTNINFGNFKNASITGKKYTDITGNSFSADDTGLGGVTINLYQGTSASGTLITSTTTASDGTYSFGDLAPGTYFVQETVPTGYVQTGGNAGYVVTVGGNGVASGGTSSGNDFDNFQKASITGKKYTDITGNSFSADDTVLGGVTINLYQGTSTSGTLLASTTTAADGSYSFGNLATGTYFVQETVPTGYVQTGGNSGYVVIVGGSGVASGGTSSGNNFDNFQKASITGKKFTDITGNSFSADDTGLGGVTINLYQGTSTSGTLLASTTTAADGSYSFGNLATGTYFVQETVPTGYVQTGGNSGYVVIVGGNGVASGGTSSGNNFDNFQKASITGKKFTDITGNSFSADDTGLGGVTINLYQGTSTSGTLLASTTTAADGSYSFGNLATGTYFVQETIPTGYVQTGGNAGYVVVVGGSGVASGGTSSGNNFDNFQKASITGKKYTDITGNSFSADDTGLGGVTINLYQGTSTSGTLLASTTTAADGSYSFGNLATGTYFVQETVPTGYVQTGGNAGYVVIVGGSGVASGGTSSGNNFDNFQKASITGKKFTDITGNSFSADDTGLGGVTINLYQGTSTSGTLLASTTTAADGSYSFGNLATGTYFVQETVPTGYVQTGGNSGYVVTVGGNGVASGGTSSGNNFDNFQNAKITGKKYKDLTSNGFSADDTGLGGVTINLYQGTSTSGTLLASTTTAADGSYSFGNLAPGTYFVQETVPTGYVQTGGNAGYVVTVGPGGVSGGGTASGKDFDNAVKQPGIDIEKLTNGVDAPTEATAVLIAPGAPVTWTYKVTNTGNVPFTKSQVVVTDDNGTPSNTADDFTPTLVASSDVGNDGILSPGEMWTFTASSTAQNLMTGPASTFNFSGSSALYGTAGNIRSFNAGSLSVKTSAFSRDSAGAWSTAYLGSYSGGLGVTDSSEGTGANNTHTIDNVGRDNYVLFEFSDTVIVDSAFLGYVVGDSDMRVWIGTKSDPFNNHLTLSDALLTSLGYTEVNETTLTTTRTADLNAGMLAGNVLVIAANTGESTQDDYFKVQNVTVQEHACYENKAVVTVPGATDSDLSHYCNPSGTPGIDIEKYVNGSDADTLADAVQIAAGNTVTWTYKVKNTGTVPFSKSQVVVTDDDGTPGNTADDFTPTFVSSSDVGADNILSPGETWTFTYSATAQDLTTLGAANTFTFSGSTALYGTAGNTMTFTSGGVSVKASAFSRDKSTGAWSTSYLGAYSGGLGVTDSSEGTGANNQHTVDNIGRDNYVLFEFSDNVIVDSAFLGYVVSDSDMTVWIGSSTDPFNNHLTLSDAMLTSLGYSEVNLTDLTTTRTADINAGNRSGNVLVIASKTGETSAANDQFKINNLVTRQAEPGYYKNVAVVTASTASDQDVGYYRNPDCVDIVYSFAGNTATTGTKGNIRTYTQNNVSVNASAFSRTTGSTGTWDTAYLGAYADGLGVTDTSEDGNNGTHRVDNIGRLNFVLFEFSTIVELDQAFLDSVVGDSDVSVYIGTFANPFHNHLTLSDSLFSGMYSETNDTTSTSARWATFNPNGVKGNVLVIAASPYDTTPDDQFKISKLDVCAEAVKFYVADATKANTYEYGPTGQALANYKIATGNTNPRGVATTAAGNTVWIIDANKNVYVYDVDGKSLGSWTASGLTTPEDITTNGTDIWIVDAGAKKVFRYSGAASRLSGSQTAVSSFALNSGNLKPTGIVTDGTNLWITDNSTTDKVFKYNLAGTLLGSWTIDAANSNPTGITIDPTNVSNIWIVDSGTSSVYRYNAAAGRLTGSQNASAVFSLASSNTNAQGIADPPPAWSEEASMNDRKTNMLSAALPVAAVVKDQAFESWKVFDDNRISNHYGAKAAAKVQSKSFDSSRVAVQTVLTPSATERPLHHEFEDFEMGYLDSDSAVVDRDHSMATDEALESAAEELLAFSV
jgi:hypothetical protein